MRRRLWRRLENTAYCDDAMTLPTFVVIGAMKAGTVSLRHYLDEHPNVFLGRGGMFGEPDFFVAEHNWPRGRGWYESLFGGAGRAAAIGLAAPSGGRRTPALAAAGAGRAARALAGWPRSAAAAR